MKVKNLFRKAYTLNHVRDRITVKEGNEKISLLVDCDPTTIVMRIEKAQKTLLKINDDSSKADRVNACTDFAIAIFGEDEARRLFDFYHNDENSVLALCGMYFSDPKNGLGKKITKAQKKNRHATL